MPDREQADALRFELGREIIGDFPDDLRRGLPPLTTAALLNSRGRAWLELPPEERKDVSRCFAFERETDTQLTAFAKDEVLRPAALVVPERATGDELKALCDLAKPPLVESLWARGNAQMLREGARGFQVAVDFSKSFPAVMRDIEAALKNYAERLGIPLIQQSRGVKTRESKSALMKLGMMRLRREKDATMNLREATKIIAYRERFIRLRVTRTNALVVLDHDISHLRNPETARRPVEDCRPDS